MTNSFPNRVTLTWICCLSVCPRVGALPASQDTNPALTDPLRAFASIPETVRKTALGMGKHTLPHGGHWQGIQAYAHDELKRQICFLSRDSHTQAVFITAVFDPRSPQLGAIRHVQTLPSDGQQPPLCHAGGIQLIGDYLVIGVEDNQDKQRSQIQFWDVSKPFAPSLHGPLTIKRESTIPKDKTAGAVGIVKREHDHLLVVANWDARDLDFYRSNGLPLKDDACSFSLALRWSYRYAHRHAWQPDQVWESYQAVNLLSDLRSNIYLLGFATDGAGRDIVDLFSVDLNRDRSNILQKLSRKQLALQGNAHFRSAGGISIDSTTRLSCWASGHNGRDGIVINMSPSEPGE